MLERLKMFEIPYVSDVSEISYVFEMPKKEIRGCIDAERIKNVANKKYVIDREYGAYTLPGYGAWMGNINEKEEINYYLKYVDEGYDLTIGPASNCYCKYGVFCKNYRELYQSKLNEVDKLIKKEISPHSKKMAVAQLLKKEHITLDDRLEWQLREKLRAMDFTGRAVDVRKRAKDFSAINVDNHVKTFSKKY